MMDEGVDRIRAAYRDNHNWLVTVKNRYDPKNLSTSVKTYDRLDDGIT
jgi:hypothetical protein